LQKESNIIKLDTFHIQIDNMCKIMRKYKNKYLKYLIKNNKIRTWIQSIQKDKNNPIDKIVDFFNAYI
jgi:hypothetical protein